jgi:hypothetical protein
LCGFFLCLACVARTGVDAAHVRVVVVAALCEWDDVVDLVCTGRPADVACVVVVASEYALCILLLVPSAASELAGAGACPGFGCVGWAVAVGYEFGASGVGADGSGGLSGCGSTPIC